MNKELWNKVLAFDFDNPPGEYGFSTRLAHENYWSVEFTEQAILEYKKFMYLAATSDLMVSPSEIIDVVWHQHLIFTQSYHNFCNLLGKQIQHIPSTHNKEDFDKFRQAKERTIKLYEKEFGKQPKNIWEYNSMFESLNLGKAKLKLRTFVILGMLAFACLIVPAYFLLKPVYVRIGNPDFVYGLMALTVVIALLLRFYNKSRLEKIVSEFDLSSFVFTLHPFELIYLKTLSISNIINGTVSELIEKGAVKVNENKIIQLAENSTADNKFQQQVLTTLSEIQPATYPHLVKKLMDKPVFTNIRSSMDALKKYFLKSQKFGKLFYTNFAVWALLILCAFTRIVTGVLREKPVEEILTVTVILVLVAAFSLQLLTQRISNTVIPHLYKNVILPSRQTQTENNWQWSYFLLGTTVLATAFTPLLSSSSTSSSGDGGSCATSSCGSSCGSSCSSCGGCGGGD